MTQDKRRRKQDTSPMCEAEEKIYKHLVTKDKERNIQNEICM